VKRLNFPFDGRNRGPVSATNQEVNDMMLTSEELSSVLNMGQLLREIAT
jgi:hypothetical protein